MGDRPLPQLLKAFLSPAGAGLVLICFFLPWVRVSCAGKEMIISGHTLGGVFWLVLGAAALSLAAFFYFHKRQKPKNARPFLLASAILALGIIIYKYNAIVRDPNIPFYVPASAINVNIKLGAVGTVIGLLMVGAGAMFLKSKDQKTENVNSQVIGTDKEQTHE